MSAVVILNCQLQLGVYDIGECVISYVGEFRHVQSGYGVATPKRPCAHYLHIR